MVGALFKGWNNMQVIRLSGNELYCLTQKGYHAANQVLGNCVYSRGALQAQSAGLRTIAGMELPQASQMAATIRHNAYQRMMAEADKVPMTSVCNIRNYMLTYPNHLEYVSTGSLLYAIEKNEPASFSSAANGQELYVLLDAGYHPLRFVFGNVVYASGITQSIRGNLKLLAQGEMKSLSAAYEKSRKLALSRILKQAQETKANALLGIETHILPFGKNCEMLLTGTACHHALLSSWLPGEFISSSLSASALWNAAQLGYIPQRFLFATSIYSIGAIGSMVSTLESFFRDEVHGLTKLMREARKNCLAKLEKQAKALGADEVMGVTTSVYFLGNGLIEFFALGTAMKKISGLKTSSKQLPPQALGEEKASLYNELGEIKEGSSFTGVFQILIFSLLLLFFIWLGFKK